ncbi:MAG: hypothetical protein ACRBFS_07030 [Aureispira sp.]
MYGNGCCSNLLYRQEAMTGEIPELDQLGALTYLEVQPLYDIELLETDYLMDMENHSTNQAQCGQRTGKNCA